VNVGVQPDRTKAARDNVPFDLYTGARSFGEGGGGEGSRHGQRIILSGREGRGKEYAKMEGTTMDGQKKGDRRRRNASEGRRGGKRMGRQKHEGMTVKKKKPVTKEKFFWVSTSGKKKLKHERGQ